MLTRGWVRYVAAYHQAHPGITERALNHARHPVHGTAYQWLAASVAGQSGVVVDVACGSSPMQPQLPAWTYLGVDRSAAELDAARAAGRGPVQLGDAAELPMADGSADAVVMSMAFMLVPQRPVLDEIARVLRPGGLFAATVPATGPVLPRDLPAVAVLAAPLHGPGRMPQHVHPRSLGRLLLDAGLQPRTRERVRFPFPIVHADDAELAVASLYTPGRSAAQRSRAVRRLRQRGIRELPVPLLRFTASRPH